MSRVFTAAVVLTATALQICAVTLNPYYIYVSPVSPTISYYPSGITNGTTGWNITYSDSPWSTYNTTPSATSQGIGAPTAFTNATWATFGFTFVGTGFTAYGWTSNNGSVQMTLDGTVISIQAFRPYSAQPVLASAAGLVYGQHRVNITLQNTGGMQFNGLSLILGAGDDA